MVELTGHHVSLPMRICLNRQKEMKRVVRGNGGLGWGVDWVIKTRVSLKNVGDMSPSGLDP